MHFTPTSASWLNMVERFFRDITVNRLRRGEFTSVPELVGAIDEHVAHQNTKPKPFIWTKTAADILQKVIRARAWVDEKGRNVRVPARRAVIAMHCITATRAGKGPGPGAQAAAATTFSCAPSNLKRGGSFTVLCMSRDQKLAGTRCAATTALAVGQQCCWWVLFAAMTLANAGPFAVNEPASAPVSLTDAAPRQISLFGR